MRLSYLAEALALCTTASAFHDTSPFVLLSTSQFTTTPDASQLQTSSAVEQTTKDFLSTCPTHRYLVVQQPNLHADELRGENSQSAPNLQRALSEDVAAKWSVASVTGEVSFSEITRSINDACARADRTHQLEEIRLPALPPSDHAGRLADNG